MFVGEPEFPVTQDPLTFANTLRALVRTLLSTGDMNPVTCLASQRMPQQKFSHTVSLFERHSLKATSEACKCYCPKVVTELRPRAMQ